MQFAMHLAPAPTPCTAEAAPEPSGVDVLGHAGGARLLLLSSQSGTPLAAGSCGERQDARCTCQRAHCPCIARLRSVPALQRRTNLGENSPDDEGRLLSRTLGLRGCSVGSSRRDTAASRLCETECATARCSAMLCCRMSVICAGLPLLLPLLPSSCCHHMCSRGTGGSDGRRGGEMRTCVTAAPPRLMPPHAEDAQRLRPRQRRGFRGEGSGVEF